MGSQSWTGLSDFHFHRRHKYQLKAKKQSIVRETRGPPQHSYCSLTGFPTPSPPPKPANLLLAVCLCLDPSHPPPTWGMRGVACRQLLKARTVPNAISDFLFLVRFKLNPFERQPRHFRT